MENGKSSSLNSIKKVPPKKISCLFTENPEIPHETSKLQEQFNAQRARMKELYLAKEKECTQMKQKLILLKREVDEKDSQLVIAEYNRQKDLEEQKQEIQTLQQLLQETCEEATIANNEISLLKNENERGRHEIQQLKDVLVQQQQVRLEII